MSLASDQEIKADILNRLIRRGCWGAKYFPTETLVKWLCKKVKRNGRRVRKLIKELVQQGLILAHKKGKTISLNPSKASEIIEYVDKTIRS